MPRAGNLLAGTGVPAGGKLAVVVPAGFLPNLELGLNIKTSLSALERAIIAPPASIAYLTSASNSARMASTIC